MSGFGSLTPEQIQKAFASMNLNGGMPGGVPMGPEQFKQYQQRRDTAGAVISKSDFEQVHAALKLCRHCPKSLPPTRELQMLRTGTDKISGLCVNCGKRPGKQTCSRCLAVEFCSPECQREFRPGHKKDCLGIESFRHLAETAADFAGNDKFLASSRVRGGQIEWVDLSKVVGWSGRRVTIEQNYILNRQVLMIAYADLGKKTQSPTAYRLAAENALDMLCMTYQNALGEQEFKRIGGWMVAGGMNQEAFNFFVYLNKRRNSKKRLPYLDIEREDADIEDPDIWERMFGKNSSKLQEPAFFPEFHIYIIGALIKYKNLQQNLMKRRKSIVKWTSFLMGTHPEVGQASHIQKLRGHHTVLQKIKKMVVNKNLDGKIIKEICVITRYLKRLDKRNK